MRISFLGLGAIGAPMAAHLATKNSLTVRLALLDKDVGIARTFLKEAGVAGPMLDLASRLLTEARAELGETADPVEAIRLIERQAGVEIRG